MRRSGIYGVGSDHGVDRAGEALRNSTGTEWRFALHIARDRPSVAAQSPSLKSTTRYIAQVFKPSQDESDLSVRTQRLEIQNCLPLTEHEA